MATMKWSIENCIYCVSVMFNVHVRLVPNHIECISLYTELIGWHCLGAES